MRPLSPTPIPARCPPRTDQTAYLLPGNPRVPASVWTGMRREIITVVAATVGAVAALLALPTTSALDAPAINPPAVAVAVAVAVPTQQPLVPWHGPVEEIFVHPVVLRPDLAFTQDALGRGFQDYFVTAREFRSMLDGLWRHGWTLVDVHRAAAGTVRVPPGRRPVVLSEDDVNYYRYFAGRGLASRLVLSGDRVLAQVGDALTDQDVVPLVDEAVAAHPELSADGAKGVLALTGYEGLLGEHDVKAAHERLRALADRLRATGWTFASHTFGHITLSRASLRSAKRDTERWRALTRELLGPVDVLVYPFGSRPSPAVRRELRDDGFTTQLDIDVRPRRDVVDGVVLMSRRHVDGLAFTQARRLADFFDVDRVRDPARP